MNLIGYFDPYDYWADPLGIRIRKEFYSGKINGKITALSLVIADWLFPEIFRKVIKINHYEHPIVVSQLALFNSLNGFSYKKQKLFIKTILKNSVYKKYGYHAWGLDMPWMSKNGMYEKDIPFITHTPYVMEALLKINDNSLRDEAFSLFYSTWDFLESLVVMESHSNSLALSYGPVYEPRIVINANSYSAFAFSLHSLYGANEAIRKNAAEKAEKTVRWVVKNQRSDGSWMYYADNEPGNFIDCFHSCFVIKNLIKVINNIPAIEGIAKESIQKGWEFINDAFLNRKRNLCRRFYIRDIKDPFKWDLYDQAEYLGLLVDLNKINEAVSFAESVRNNFFKNGDWYCRIDIFERPWGKNFLRWGIVPFLYQYERLQKKIIGL